MYRDNQKWGCPSYLVFFFMGLVTCCVWHNPWHPPRAQTPASSWTRVQSEEESAEQPGLERAQGGRLDCVPTATPHCFARLLTTITSTTSKPEDFSRLRSSPSL